MNKRVLLTMDIDWTSEAVIKSALDFVKSLNVPCILFQTHQSETINNEKSSLFTKELHPNFCENSDHGSSINEIIGNLKRLEHNGIAIRAHKYNMPNEALTVYTLLGFKFSLNNYTDLQYKKPYKTLANIYEINTFFEDGLFLKNKKPFETNYIIDRMEKNGIYVFNIHPIHLAFNPSEYTLTRDLKDKMTKNEYRNISDVFIEKNRFKGYGINSFLTDLIIKMKHSEFEFISINEVLL